MLRLPQGGGMRHNKALRAVARKRLKVIYAVMRDAAPYSAWAAVGQPGGGGAPGALMGYAENRKPLWLTKP